MKLDHAGRSGQGLPYHTRLSMILYFLKGSGRYFFAAVFSAALMALLDLINPRIVGYTVDSIIGDSSAETILPLRLLINALGGPAYLKTHLWTVSLTIVGVALAAAFFRYCFRRCNTTGSETLVRTMRDALYDQITVLPLSWYSGHRTGDLIQRCTADVEMVKTFVSEQMINLLRIVILIVLAMYFIAGISPALAVTEALFIPVVFLYSAYFHDKVGSSYEDADVEEGKLSSIAQENLTGIRVVRAFGREQYERQRFAAQNDIYTKTYMYHSGISTAFWTTGDLVSATQVMVMTVLGAYFCVKGRISAGDYIALASYTAMLTWPVRMMAQAVSEMSKASVSLDRIREIMNAAPQEDRPDAEEPDMSGDIVFEDVSFAYPAESTQEQDEDSPGKEPRQVLEHLSLTIPAGSTVGILGGTGSGKSTLVRLLTRLYELPEGQGRITVGGHDIAHIRLKWLRRHIGTVLQEPYLFSGSIAENIAVTKDRTDLNAVRKYADMAALDSTVAHFADGYETYIGERGMTLSGGQIQRAAIARMLMGEPPVMIFDDSLSAVDAATDQEIRARLSGQMQGRTVILIAHRITTLMDADQIYLLDRGRIIEKGSHRELLEMGGLYRRIYDLQSSQGEFDTEA
ncbi:MAG: ABC transporter ATP-binding protein [Lachnospiraceae bacterium]|nr:ABC transporter ATP-binding protein [Lachnospiraceae bacterium]